MPSEYEKQFPDSFSLETRLVELRLLSPGDWKELLPLAEEESIWTWFTQKVNTESALRQWIADALRERGKGVRMPFAIIDKETGRLCGSTSYGNISFYDKRVEIGWSWLGVPYMGTGINRQAKFALLCHAFEAMDMERVEVKTDALNARSRAALQRIGMREEGILRNHMQMFDNRRRDSVYYSIIKSEWPEVKQKFFGYLL